MTDPKDYRGRKILRGTLVAYNFQGMVRFGTVHKTEKRKSRYSAEELKYWWARQRDAESWNIFIQVIGEPGRVGKLSKVTSTQNLVVLAVDP